MKKIWLGIITLLSVILVGGLSMKHNIVQGSIVNDETARFPLLPVVYQAETGIVAPATVVSWIQTEDALKQVVEGARKPQNIVLRINADLLVVDHKNNVMDSISNVLSKVYQKVIPGFYTEDESTAIQLANLLKTYEVKDTFLVSKNLKALKAANDTYAFVRGVAWFSNEKGAELGTSRLDEIRALTRENHGMVALLGSKQATKQNLEYLQHRALTVWAESDGSTVQHYKAIASGSQGIVTTNNYQEIYDIYQSVQNKTIVRKVFTIAHRGFHKVHPENSIEAAVASHENGSDIVELDVRLTKDQEVVVIHDANTARVADRNITISGSMLSTIQQIELNNNDGTKTGIKIPTFRAFLEAFQDKKGIVIFVEIKETSQLLVEKTIAIIEELNMVSQVSVIAFGKQDLVQFAETYPKMTTGFLVGGDELAGTTEKALDVALNLVVPVRASLNPHYGPAKPELISALLCRGITTWPWTINKPEIESQYRNGGTALTSDDSDYLMDTEAVLRVKNFITFQKNSKNLALEAIVYQHSGQSKNVETTLTMIDPNQKVLEIADGKITSIMTSGVVYGYTTYQATLPNGEQFTLMSELIEIQVKKPGSIIIWVFVTIGVAFISGFTFLFHKTLLNRKKKK